MANEQKLKVEKAYNRSLWDIRLKEDQAVRILDKDGYIMAEVEYRNGQLYLMKSMQLKGHTHGTNIDFGKEVQ